MKKGSFINSIIAILMLSSFNSSAQNSFIDFDGVDDEIILENFNWPATGGPITIEFWNYISGGGFRTSAFSNIPSPNVNENRIHAHTPWQDNYVYWDYGNRLTTGRIRANYAPYLNKWTHIALVSEGNGGSFKGIYFDGVLVAFDNGPSDGPDVVSEDFFLGKFGSGSPFPYKGQMDEFRIWNDVRTLEEINQNKDKELVGNEPNLVVYLRFNEGMCGGDNTGLTSPQVLDYAAYGGRQNGNWVNFDENGCSSNFVCSEECSYDALNLIPGPAIPTLSQWGIIALGMLTMIFGVLSVRQRKTSLT